MRVRGSRFLALADAADSDEAARELLASLQRSYFDATHHCSAWRLRDGVWRVNDSGEPSGSAGAPILGAIDSAGVTDAVVVVVRYFGGTKLGVGGLSRAYADAAGAALEIAPRREGLTATRLRVRYDYAHTAAVMRSLESVRAAEIEHGFSREMAVAEVTASVPDGAVARLTERLRESTSGEVEPEAFDRTLLYRPTGTAPPA